MEKEVFQEMMYDDFPAADRELISAFLDAMNEHDEVGLYVDDLRDDEIFFTDADEIGRVMAPWRGSPGSYGSMAAELDEFLAIPDPPALQPHDMSWATIAATGDGRYIVYSNSYSDSGLFLNGR